MTAFVSLFRGINVGGHHKVRMSELKELHEALGLKHVLPYIQSGNVVFESEDVDDGMQLQQRIEDDFEKTFGFHAHVIVRTSVELDEIIERSPFQHQQDKESKWIAILFLATSPAMGAQEDLRKAYSGPEEIFILGKEVYIYYPESIGRSKLSHSLLEKKLKTVGTARNWNTVLRLQELSLQ